VSKVIFKWNVKLDLARPNLEECIMKDRVSHERLDYPDLSNVYGPQLTVLCELYVISFLG
jgi:hypothetical protein